MEGKGNISDYRKKLDKTLASPDLTNDETVHTLVKNQLLQSPDSQLRECSDYVVKKRSKEVSHFLTELRSASVNDERSKSGDDSHRAWKVKQDSDELRVMYREGPEGTPFHTLLAEGFVDGPVDVCLCISSESDMYKHWWPQATIPTFRVLTSYRAQKVRMGEQISLVRMKLSWPMSSREALVHYFTFEYFQDGLIVVLLKSIPDAENVDISTHGFSRDGIPNAQDVVRIDLLGGFAIQKVTENRSYFRTIANMDIKLDFVPPAFINFVARQLVGSGFKLYKKEVASVSKGDGTFRMALKDPLYTRIHKALYLQKGSVARPSLDETNTTSITLEGQSSDEEINESDDSNIISEVKNVGAQERVVIEKIENFEERESNRFESLVKGTEKTPVNLTNEITEEVRIDKIDDVYSNEITEEVSSDKADVVNLNEITEEVRIDKIGVENRNEVKRGHEFREHFGYDIETKFCISPDVRQALGTLEKAISIVREYHNSPRKGQYEVTNDHLINFEDDAGEESISWEADELRKKDIESSKIRSAELTHVIRNSSDNYESRHGESMKETNQSKISPAGSPDEAFSSPSDIKHMDLLSSVIQINGSTAPENKTDSFLPTSDAKVNGGKATTRKNKKLRFSCLSFSSGKLK